MTVVVADTSPLNYLVLIGQIGVLRLLYGKILAPPEVIAELADSGAPPEVRDWIRSSPEWLEVRGSLIDDAAGRIEADRRHIRNTGTLGVLRAAAMRQLLDLPTALTRLAATNFRISLPLINDLLTEDLERRHRSDN